MGLAMGATVIAGSSVGPGSRRKTTWKLRHQTSYRESELKSETRNMWSQPPPRGHRGAFIGFTSKVRLIPRTRGADCWCATPHYPASGRSKAQKSHCITLQQTGVRGRGSIRHCDFVSCRSRAMRVRSLTRASSPTLNCRPNCLSRSR